jgi:DNA-binding IclR family transcriptional regulator
MPPRNIASYAASAVEKAMAVLEALETARPSSLTGLSRELNRGRSSVSRLLATLLLRGYIEKDATSDRCQLTYRLFAVGSRAAEQLGLGEAARPIMRRLASRTGETASLGVLDGFRTVSLSLVERAHPLHICGKPTQGRR